MRVAAGAIARKFLQERLGVRVYGYLAQLGPLELGSPNLATKMRTPTKSARRT